MSIKGVKRVKRIFEKSLLRAVFGFVIFVSSFSNLAITAFAASPGLYDFYAKNGVLFYSANTTGCSPNGGASQGGSSPGNQSANALEQAKNVIDTLQSRGFSGAAIAGVLSNIEAEGGLTIPDRAEGHYGDDEANNGVGSGVIPIPSGSAPGAGPFQITPYTDFAALGDAAKWQAPDSVAKQTLWMLANKNNGNYTESSIANQTDPTKAALMWANGYEGGYGESWWLNPSTQGGNAYKHISEAAGIYADPSFVSSEGKTLKEISADPSKQQGPTTSSNNSNSSSTSSGGCGNNSSSAGKTGQISGSSKAGKAISWIENSSNWNSTTDGGKPGINIAGSDNAQCYQLGVAYVNQMTGHSGGIYGGNDMPENMKSSGQFTDWTYVSNPTLSQLSIGAITYETSPHTEVIIGISGNIITFLTQNPDSPNITTVTYSGSGPVIGSSGQPITNLAIPPSSYLN